MDTQDKSEVNSKKDFQENSGEIPLGIQFIEQPYKLKMSDYIKPGVIINTVPMFTRDEHGVKFRNFAIACEDTKLSLPVEAELALAQFLKTRLGRIALPFTQSTHFETVQALLTHLRKIFAPCDSSLSLRGELGRIH